GLHAGPSSSPMRCRPCDRLLPGAAALVALALADGCAPSEDPPGRTVFTSHAALNLKRPGEAEPTPPIAAPGTGALLPGRGAKIASIAMRTWIYVAPNDRSTKLGYLRAGAVVERAEASAGTDGCAGGWYRIAPRGYVCVGKGASLSLNHQVVEAA